MSYSQATLTKIAAMKNFIDGKSSQEQAILNSMVSLANNGTLAHAMLTDMLTNDFINYPDSSYFFSMLEDAETVWTTRQINGLYTVFVRYQEAQAAAQIIAPSANMKAAGECLDISNEGLVSNANQALAARCMTIINNVDAMAEILKEAVSLFAQHNKTTPEMVLEAYRVKHPVAVKDLERLIQQAVIELAKASFSWVSKAAANK